MTCHYHRVMKHDFCLLLSSFPVKQLSCLGHSRLYFSHSHLNKCVPPDEWKEEQPVLEVYSFLHADIWFPKQYFFWTMSEIILLSLSCLLNKLSSPEAHQPLWNLCTHIDLTQAHTETLKGSSVMSWLDRTSQSFGGWSSCWSTSLTSPKGYIRVCLSVCG